MDSSGKGTEDIDIILLQTKGFAPSKETAIKKRPGAPKRRYLTVVFGRRVVHRGAAENPTTSHKPDWTGLRKVDRGDDCEPDICSGTKSDSIVKRQTYHGP